MMDDSDSLAGDHERPRHNVLNTMINIDFTYVTNTWLGRVKLAQLICVTLAGCILPSVIGWYFTRFSFFTFVVWTSFMYIVVDLVLHITSLWRRLPSLLRMSDIWIYPVLIGALAFLISSALILSVADLHPGSRGSRIGVSGAFGLFTMVLFLIEAYLHYKNSKTNNNNADEEQPSLGGRTISMPVTRVDDDPPSYKESGHATPVGSY